MEAFFCWHISAGITRSALGDLVDVALDDRAAEVWGAPTLPLRACFTEVAQDPDGLQTIGALGHMMRAAMETTSHGGGGAKFFQLFETEDLWFGWWRCCDGFLSWYEEVRGRTACPEWPFPTVEFDRRDPRGPDVPEDLGGLGEKEPDGLQGPGQGI